jgi:hypothetical protein
MTNAISDTTPIFRQRKKIIEHPFGTTEAVWGFKRFLCRTKERVANKQSPAFLICNWRRVANIFNGNGEDMLAIMASMYIHLRYCSITNPAGCGRLFVLPTQYSAFTVLRSGFLRNLNFSRPAPRFLSL